MSAINENKSYSFSSLEPKHLVKIADQLSLDDLKNLISSNVSTRDILFKFHPLHINKQIHELYVKNLYCSDLSEMIKTNDKCSKLMNVLIFYMATNTNLEVNDMFLMQQSMSKLSFITTKVTKLCEKSIAKHKAAISGNPAVIITTEMLPLTGPISSTPPQMNRYLNDIKETFNDVE